jgi:hypothetical protein
MLFEIAKDVGENVGGGTGSLKNAVSAVGIDAHIEGFTERN